MSVGIWDALIPLAALAVNVLVHLVAIRLLPRRMPYGAVLIGFFAGAATCILFIWRWSPATANEDRWPVLVIVPLTYVALAYGYFAFANLSMASLRIRLLQDIDDAGGSLSEAQLRRSYNEHEIFEVRVQRLVQTRQLVERNGRLFIGNGVFLWLAYLIDGLRLIVFGRAGGAVVR